MDFALLEVKHLKKILIVATVGLACAALLVWNRNNTETTREFHAGNFSDFERFFEGFDAYHIQNFHYFTSTSERSLVPGPSIFTIFGYFEIIEEFWDYYIEEHSWMQQLPSITPNIHQLDYSFNWEASQSWNNTHPLGV